MSFLPAPIPMMSSLSPMKKMGTEAPNTPSHRTEVQPKASENANDTKVLHSVAAKSMTPPTVGTDRWCSFLDSLGSSTRCLRLATMMREGMPKSTTKKANVAGSIKEDMVRQR